MLPNLNTPAILGMDCLETFGTFGIDWASNTMKISCTRVILGKRRHGSVLAPAVVTLIEDQVVPPRSQCFVRTNFNQSYKSQHEILFSPFVDKMAR